MYFGDWQEMLTFPRVLIHSYYPWFVMLICISHFVLCCLLWVIDHVYVVIFIWPLTDLQFLSFSPLQPRYITHKIHFVFSEIFRLVQWIFWWNRVYISYFPCSATTVIWYKFKTFGKCKNIYHPYNVIFYRPTKHSLLWI